MRTVFFKELIDAARDRRSLLSALIFPLLMPLLIGGMFHLLVQREASSGRLELPTVGAERAPELASALRQAGLDLTHVSPEQAAAPTEAVKARSLPAVLVISADYAEALATGRPADVQLFLDDSHAESRRLARRAERAILEHSGRIGALRLIARGVDPSVASPIAIERHDASTQAALAAQVLGLFPMLALMAAFIGGMQVAIDTTAGERERGSLEPLLINPAPRVALTLGKWLTATLFALVSAWLTLGLSALSMNQVDLAQIGLPFQLSLRQALTMALLVLPIAPLASALEMSIATFARSYKEAQTYLSVVLFIPMLPGMWLTMSPTATEPWMTLVPILGQTALLGDVLGGKDVTGSAIAIASLSATLLSLAAVAFAARLLQSERVVFGR
ncbi:MAG: ABC transporter permease [Polyangiaceae bacterium]|nr:ABC transporter permease [Polyangiaceae bacterium]MCW5790341.1 ABC transporter permease [Polyangiaceae bacterium]